ncbi:MAG: diguanylate cyclase [bacterium]|nr:diguanylate cyclase [bacterium]
MKIQSSIAGLIKSRSQVSRMFSYIALVVLIGFVDFLTGIQVSVSTLYLIPIAMAAWFSGRMQGLMVSLLSASAWLIADLQEGRHYPMLAAPYWNALVMLSIFLIVAFLLAKIKNLLQHEESLAREDYLTGIANKRSFAELTDFEIKRFARYGHFFSVAYFDVDNFKQINDRYGHNAGDELLKTVAAGIKNKIRETDLVARLGGDEFAVFMPETGTGDAEAVISKLIQDLSWEMEKNKWPVTFSVGLVTFLTPPRTVDEMIAKTDRLMYSAKASGKNMIKREVLVN